jgi:hypothetical protein
MSLWRVKLFRIDAISAFLTVKTVAVCNAA